MGPEIVYVSGRIRAEGEMNGKSANLNNCLSHLYPDGCRVPANEIVCIFDADQVRCTPLPAINCPPGKRQRMCQGGRADARPWQHDWCPLAGALTERTSSMQVLRGMHNDDGILFIAFVNALCMVVMTCNGNPARCGLRLTSASSSDVGRESSSLSSNKACSQQPLPEHAGGEPGLLPEDTAAVRRGR